MLTKRQKQTLDYIKSYSKKKDYAPSLEEIKKHLKLSSVSTAHHHIKNLEELGYLKKGANQPRSTEIYKKEQLIQISLAGTIAAGEAIEAIEEKESIAVPKKQLRLFNEKKDIYALKVVGNSMIDENINDGDIVLVKKQSVARNGEKVVALIDNQEATLKKFYKERGQIRLQPANKTIEPIIIKKNREFAIQGIVVDIIKNETTAPTTIKQAKKETVKQYKKLPLNKIICGDALSILKKFPDKSVDTIITDPPYGISRELNCKNKRLGTTAKLNFNFGNWDQFNKEWFEIAIKKINAWMVCFCGKKEVGILLDLLEKEKFVAIDVLVWQKPDPLPLNAKSRFLNAWEAIVVGKRPNAFWGSSYEHNIFKFQAPKGKNRIHPTQKPLTLIKKLVTLTSKKDEIILDPFIGSGTTAVACKELGRNYIGVEKSKKYCKIAQNNVKKTNTNLL